METAYKCCLISKPRRFHSRSTPPPPDAPPPPEDVGALFSLHAGGAPHMDEDGLRRCLGAYQGGGEGEGLDDDVERLLEKIRGTGGGGPRIPRQQLFTLDDFHRILFSHDVNPPLRRRRVHHDMTLPLSHYFIYSGHNPYYATPPADQRRGGRSDEPIVRALKMGVRAIEVAMWPNSKEDDIKIRHGWTQNTPVLLTECLKSIKEYAFVASRYPVIITLEDNLPTSKLQQKAAKVVLDVFGDILYWPHTYHVDVRGNADTNNPLKEFPSPEDLKGRVLLSIKPPSPIIKKGKAKPMEVDGTTEQGDATAWGAEVPDFQTENQPAKKHDGDASGSGHQRRLNDENDDEDQKEQKMQPHEYPLYRHLITIRPEKQKATERVSTLGNEPWGITFLSVPAPKDWPRPRPRRGPTYKPVSQRVSTLESEPAPEVLLRGGLKTNKTIERVSTWQNELDEVWRRGRLKTNETTEILPTLQSEPTPEVWRRGRPKYKPVKRVPTLQSEPAPEVSRRGGPKYKPIKRVPTLQSEPTPEVLRRGGLKMNKTIERVSTLENEPAPEVSRRGGPKYKPIERVPTLPSEPTPEVLPRRGGLKTNKTIERVSTLENEPAPEVLSRGRLKPNKIIERMSTLEPMPSPIANQTKEIEKVSLVDALHSEPGKVRRLSWSKQQTEKAAKDRGTDIVRFTQRNILRIYPSVSTDRYYPRPTRLTSSNYNPFLGWVHGAQMVALNLQEYGRALWLMHGFYRANGGCGYEYGRDLSLIHGFRRACKPDLVMQTEPAEVFDPRERQPVKKTLKVKVYMGDGWLMDFKHAHTFIPDLWTSVGIAGVPADTTAMQNTKATEDTWVPVWEDEFSFPLTVPEIALLRVEVHQYDVSEKDIFGGQTVLPVWELRPGIRAVALFDRQGNRLPNVRLLMRFEFV